MRNSKKNFRASPEFTNFEFFMQYFDYLLIFAISGRIADVVRMKFPYKIVKHFFVGLFLFATKNKKMISCLVDRPLDICCINSYQYEYIFFFIQVISIMSPH